MKKNFIFIFLLLTDLIISPAFVLSPVDYVNDLVGTQSKQALSNGNTYPAIARPWEMNFGRLRQVA